MNSAKTARARGLVLPVLLAGLLTGCAGLLGSDGTGYADLKAGDCFTNPSTESGAENEEVVEVVEVDLIPCDEPHQQEVFFVSEMSGGDYPGEGVLDLNAKNVCTEEFEGYVGSTVEETTLIAGYIIPTPESWDQENDRAIMCTLGDTTGEEVSESYKDSGL
ncbi:septum formation family protein [Arthrobacter sp. zg-Y238]|uniref:septum formation family protein n=1 Tax=Arthrobacter sp. zg-Y238 TaxID=2964614 RepID=UPI00210777DB|nr:septum formation family protein [Arthrobacter sp. zg-Y238]MCQ1954624.1 septum formation family protein [Arthrobacter sp. zg-Y238]